MGFRATDRWRGGVCVWGVALVCAVWPAVMWAQANGGSAGQRRLGESSVWERAERAREEFEAMPEEQRTRVEYTRVLDGFRAVYHGAPGDVHAAEAVHAVAELLAEQGRAERDAGLLRAAVKQYEFLRTQYPGSSLRVGALLAEGQIEENDLGDAAAARERYEALLREYPRSGLVEEARAGLRSLDAADKGARSRADVAPQKSVAIPAARGRDGTAGENGPSRSVQDPTPRGGAAMNGAPRQGTEAAPEQANPASATAAPIVRAPARKRGPLAVVTGIRHWSTPSYTRVAIDLGGEVEYEAARVPGPDRIYFDLHGARLAPELVGKSFAVTDDGFLKKIRVAQSQGDMARVVLDVNDVTEYSAFLLPNPYRLIIDIHGGAKPAGTPMASMDAPARPAATVPNTRAMNGGSGADVARLSEQPGKVEATSVPTSEPIAAVVPARSREQPKTREAGTANAEQPAGPRGSTGGAGTGVSSTRGVGSSSAAAGAGSSAAGSSAASSGTGSSAVGDVGGSNSLGVSAKRGRKGRATGADAKVVGDPAAPARAAVPTADGQTSLVRALGLKVGRIVIDAGHGGHDSGTLGVDGLEEKDVVLDVALRLGKLLHERLGAEVIYTRSDDTFIPLETRTAIANKAQADLFLSIHANSSPEPSARGVETYYLNFTQQADALAVAARENAVSDQSIYQLSDLVKKIALKDKIAESREFATDVETSLYGGLQRGNAGLKDRGVKKAPFVVLIGANMPSILAEISFVTNPKDASELREPEYRERVAESLYKGVARYAGGLSGTKPATAAVAKAGGQ